MLDVADFGPNPAAPELGGYGICHVRFGKAMRQPAPAPGRGVGHALGRGSAGPVPRVASRN